MLLGHTIDYQWTMGALGIFLETFFIWGVGGGGAHTFCTEWLVVGLGLLGWVTTPAWGSKWPLYRPYVGPLLELQAFWNVHQSV